MKTSNKGKETERARKVAARLRKAYPDSTTALAYKTPFQLLVATILSAQCTDERVNQVTRELFRRWPDAASLSQAPIGELERVIRPTGFFRQKAKAIRGTAARLAAEHGGEVPRSMEAMLKLPGVARKTANVVLGTAFGLATGVVVDTHVRRLARRLGLSAHDDPNKIEQDLMALLPKKEWVAFGHNLIWHGRRVCTARRPDCEHCVLAGECPSAFAC